MDTTEDSVCYSTTDFSVTSPGDTEEVWPWQAEPDDPNLRKALEDQISNFNHRFSVSTPPILIKTTLTAFDQSFNPRFVVPMNEVEEGDIQERPPPRGPSRNGWGRNDDHHKSVLFL